MISVNQVYQTVLAVANKEQRGYITPQEFNLFAEQAQMDIFQQYFYDLNQFRRNPGNNTVVGDVDDILEEKIDRFSYNTAIAIGNNNGIISNSTLSSDLYKIFNLVVTYTLGVSPNDEEISSVVEQVSLKDYTNLNKSPLTKPTIDAPVYYLSGFAGQTFPYNIFVKPTVEDLVSLKKPATQVSANITYIRKPKRPNWTYVIVNNKPLYNISANDHQDFELHVSETTLLTKKILQLAGVSIKDYNVTQFAAQDEVKTIQQQKS